MSLSRREFFKKAAKTALPLIGGIILLQMGVSCRKNTVQAESEKLSCEGSCSDFCQSSCGYVCSQACDNSCIGTCRGYCDWSGK